MTDSNLSFTDSFGIPIYIIEKKKNEQLRISINEYRGHQYIDIRLFYRNEDQLLPSKKGITLPVDEYPELLEGILLLGQALGFDEEELSKT